MPDSEQNKLTRDNTPKLKFTVCCLDFQRYVQQKCHSLNNMQDGDKGADIIAQRLK